MLWIALFLNAAMFIVGLAGGIIAESSALLADSLDMLADALAYSVALVAVGRRAVFKAHAANLSGTILFVLGVSALVDVGRRAIFGASPESTTMLLIAALSLAVNSTVLYLLREQRRGEVHLRATWLFTRADVIANLAVIGSAILIRVTGWRSPDLIIGGAIALYVLREALEILRSARVAARSASTGKD